MSKINVKKALLDIVKENNLVILKIDLYNDFEYDAREGYREHDKFCKTYVTLEDLDFEVVSFLLNDEVRGIVYCQDKDTKEPVWIEPLNDECYSWWHVSRVPAFYKDKEDKTMSKERERAKICVESALSEFELYESLGIKDFLKSAYDNMVKALKELED